MRPSRPIVGGVVLAVLGLTAFLGVAPARSATYEYQDLQKQLNVIEAQITQYQKQLVTIKGEKKTLANKITELQQEQAALNLEIKSSDLQLADTDSRIQETIQAVTDKLHAENGLHNLIAEYLRRLRQEDAQPLYPELLSGIPLSQIIDDANDYSQFTQGLQVVLGELKNLKGQLASQEAALKLQRETEQNLISLKLLQQDALTSSVGEQNTLLKQTKNKEANYQTALQDNQKQAAAIRSRIYQLLDVSTQINFGQAYQIASWVSAQTGVRPAFLLAILTQESNLGHNVGTCNRLGDPASKSWKVIMKPDRDQQPFLAITKELGRDPNVTAVSCPMRDKNGNQVGWGGAMGPAQFIPSTWMLYKDKVSAITGKSPANPWDIRDAFLAAALLLRNAGANGTTQGEWNAAMRYFSGSTNVAYRFYGDNVAALADKYQADIDSLNAK
jgi:membrane-bound lytic murein transglycosylase B